MINEKFKNLYNGSHEKVKLHGVEELIELWSLLAVQPGKEDFVRSKPFKQKRAHVNKRI